MPFYKWILTLASNSLFQAMIFSVFCEATSILQKLNPEGPTPDKCSIEPTLSRVKVAKIFNKILSHFYLKRHFKNPTYIMVNYCKDGLKTLPVFLNILTNEMKNHLMACRKIFEIIQYIFHYFNTWFFRKGKKCHDRKKDLCKQQNTEHKCSH